MSGRIIKRYANRKLYDTEESCYVTLEQIAEMIRKGEDVKVVDNNSKEDLTSVTLAQIIFEEEKKQRSFLPLSALRNIIQSGGESISELMNQISESAERVGRVFRSESGERKERPKESLPEAEASTPDWTEPARFFREFKEGVQKAVDDWQRRLDDNLRHALESVSPLAPLQKEIQTLRDRIQDLESKATQLESASPEQPDHSN